MEKVEEIVYQEIRTDTWIKQRELLYILHKQYRMAISVTLLQTVIRRIRQAYKEGEVFDVVIKSCRGYKRSSDEAEITRFAKEMIQAGNSQSEEGRTLLEVFHRRQ